MRREAFLGFVPEKVAAESDEVWVVLVSGGKGMQAVAMGAAVKDLDDAEVAEPAEGATERADPANLRAADFLGRVVLKAAGWIGPRQDFVEAHGRGADDPQQPALDAAKAFGHFS